MSVYKQQFLAQHRARMMWLVDTACAQVIENILCHSIVMFVLYFRSTALFHINVLHLCTHTSAAHHTIGCALVVRQDVANMKWRVSFPPNHFQISFYETQS